MCLKVQLSFFLLVVFVTPNTGELSACERDYTKRGCYPGMKNVLPVLLDNKRDAIDWHDFEGFIHMLACHCADLAKKNGYKLFGIRYYGECWAGNDVMLFEKYAHREKIPGRHCISHNYLQCEHKDSRECVGTENGEYIFEIVQRDSQVINGGFSEWSDWSPCSASCGEGRISRERVCNNPEPHGTDAKDCDVLGDYTETKKCFQRCLINGGYSEWTSWSSCSVTCGKGVRTKSRECNNPRPQNGGRDCSYVGSSQLSESCNSKPCPIRCNFAPGDGTGGSEKHIGYFKTREQCINACILRKKTEPTINGVTLGLNAGRQNCYCEYGMKRRNSNRYWNSCILGH